MMDKMAPVRRVDLCFAIILITILSSVTGQDGGFRPNVRGNPDDFAAPRANPKFAPIADLRKNENLVDTGDTDRSPYRRGAAAPLDPNAGAAAAGAAAAAAAAGARQFPAPRIPALDLGAAGRPPQGQHNLGNDPPRRPLGDNINLNNDRQFPPRREANVAPGNDNQGYAARGLGLQGGQLNQGAWRPESPPAAQRQLPAASGRRAAPIKIADSPACKNDVKHYCSGSSASNNFAVLDCLQNDEKGSMDITTECQHFIWTYKRNLTTDIRFDSAASEVCKEEIAKSAECRDLPKGHGQVIPCLIDTKDNVSSASCKQFLNKMASIVFSDYRLIYKFTEACGDDISQLQCGRLHPEGDDAPHSQGATVECLSEKVGDLKDNCKHEILRIAELQADDFHMDRPLYYACREDRERFCKSTKAGSGKVYKCLYRHKFDKGMSNECQEMLVRRQQTMQDNYKVNKGLSDACHQDVKTHRCLKGDIPKGRQARLSTILLCLEGAIRDGQDVAPECVSELQEMRRSLMEDYKISPNVIQACSSEIRNGCDGLQRDGKTIHCLMDLAKSRRRRPEEGRMGTECRRALEDLIQEADAGEDVRIDPVLNEACRPVIDTACKDIEPGSGKIMDCLMEHLNSKVMSPMCEEKLMELQYFVARDFKLDPRLYRYCKANARDLCGAPADWHDGESMAPGQGPFTFACLYRIMKSSQAKGEEMLSRACAFEVRRIMRQRAVSVDLEPRIEDPCLNDLGEFCSQNTKKGEELKCLEDNYENLEKDCKVAVANYTEDVDKDPRLDHILMMSCTPMIKRFCQDMLTEEGTQPGDIMQCLIKFKNHADMERKCAAGVEHHQLITMKDYSFSYKFKEACKGDVNSLCKGKKKKVPTATLR